MFEALNRQTVFIAYFDSLRDAPAPVFEALLEEAIASGLGSIKIPWSYNVARTCPPLLDPSAYDASAFPVGLMCLTAWNLAAKERRSPTYRIEWGPSRKSSLSPVHAYWKSVEGSPHYDAAQRIFDKCVELDSRWVHYGFGGRYCPQYTVIGAILRLKGASGLALCDKLLDRGSSPFANKNCNPCILAVVEHFLRVKRIECAFGLYSSNTTERLSACLDWLERRDPPLKVNATSRRRTA
jgi:hypothetical protein